MSIEIEFFGIPRLRAGVERTTVLPDESQTTLSAVLAAIATQCPDFARDCMHEGRLRDGYVVSVDGETFTRRDDLPVSSGQSILILSTDAGG